MLDLNSFEQGNFDLNIDSNKDLNPNPNSGFNNMNIDDEEQKRILARQKEDEERKERINKKIKEEEEKRNEIRIKAAEYMAEFSQKRQEEIENEKLIEAENKANNKETEFNEKEIQIYKYQRIYYYDRRKRREKKLKEKNNKKDNRI